VNVFAGQQLLLSCNFSSLDVRTKNGVGVNYDTYDFTVASKERRIIKPTE